jgi:hypothetical protein
MNARDKACLSETDRIFYDLCLKFAQTGAFTRSEYNTWEKLKGVIGDHRAYWLRRGAWEEVGSSMKPRDMACLSETERMFYDLCLKFAQTGKFTQDEYSTWKELKGVIGDHRAYWLRRWAWEEVGLGPD